MVNYAYVSSFSADLSCFIAGLSLAWTSPENPKLSNSTNTPFDEPATDDELSWISSLLALGATFGPFIFGFAVDKFGRKLTILSLAVPYLISYIILTFAKLVPLFYVARFLIGLGIGGSFTALPIYVGEIAEDSNRGALGSAMNCFLCLGLLVSYSFGAYVSVMLFNGVLIAVPVLFFLTFFFLAPESPHYFIDKQQPEKAREALKKLRGKYSNDIDRELEEIQASKDKTGKGTFTDLFKSKGLIKASVISVALVSFQQLSGINAVLFFSQDIFQASGSSIPPEVCAIIIGATQFITSFISPLAADKLGRRALLIMSGVGMVLSEVPLGVYFILKKNGTDVSSISFLPVLCLVVYIIMYNSGFGPLPWAVMGELFPTHVKSIASSSTASVCWFLGFLITKFFKSISDSIGTGQAFLIFAGFNFAAVVFCIFYLIETKGKSLNEIQEALEK